MGQTHIQMLIGGEPRAASNHATFERRSPLGMLCITLARM